MALEIERRFLVADEGCRKRALKGPRIRRGYIALPSAGPRLNVGDRRLRGAKCGSDRRGSGASAREAVIAAARMGRPRDHLPGPIFQCEPRHATLLQLVAGDFEPE